MEISSKSLTFVPNLNEFLMNRQNLFLFVWMLMLAWLPVSVRGWAMAQLLGAVTVTSALGRSACTPSVTTRSPGARSASISTASALRCNICTEDMVFMCQELGIETGIDLEALIEASLLAERVIGRTLSGRVMHSGSLKGFRAGQRMQEICGAVR